MKINRVQEIPNTKRDALLSERTEQVIKALETANHDEVLEFVCKDDIDFTKTLASLRTATKYVPATIKQRGTNLYAIKH